MQSAGSEACTVEARRRIQLTSPKRSLEDFARDAGRPGKAWLAQIPEHDEVVAAYRAGTAPSVITRWLREVCGYSAEEAGSTKISWYLSRNFPRG